MGKFSINVPLKNRDRINRVLQIYNVTLKWKLSPKSLEIAAELYYQYLTLKKDNKDIEAIMGKLFSKDNKKEIVKKYKTSEASLGNMLTEFRKIGIVRGNKLFTPYIPSSILEEKFIFEVNFK